MTWLNVSLGEVLPFRYGKGLPARDRSESGEYTVVSSAGSIGSHNVPLTTGPSIVIGRKGTIGATYYCPNPVWPIDTTFYVEPSSSTDIRFAYYLLSSLPLNEMNNDSAVPGLNRAHAESLEISLPPLLEQRAIAATLGALDDKIESNRRAMAKLDELFHAMWRREYDGVPVETEEPLSEHVTTQYGLTASASSDADGDKFLRVTDINKQNWIDWTRVPFAPTDDSSRAKYSLSKGDLLVARMADPGKSAIYDGGPIAVFASYLVRLKPSSYEEALFIYGFLKSSEYLDYATGAMTGSVQKNMNAKVIVAASLRWPDSSTLSRFAEHAGPLRDKIAQIVEESSRLSTLRDALLLELLSGRIRTGDLEVGS